MAAVDPELQGDFDTALGESFSDYVSPPVPFEDASPHECCEAVWLAGWLSGAT